MELAHAPETRGGESAHTGAASTDERGKVTDGILTSTSGGNLAADEFADAPVEVNQLIKVCRKIPRQSGRRTA